MTCLKISHVGNIVFNKGWQQWTKTYKLFLNEQRSISYLFPVCMLLILLDFSKKSTDSQRLWSSECCRCRCTLPRCQQGVPAAFQSCCFCSGDLHGLWVRKRSWRRAVPHALGLLEAVRLQEDEGLAEQHRSGSWVPVKVWRRWEHLQYKLRWLDTP